MGDLLVTVAPTGAETDKADCPQLPTTLEELVETAQRCEAAGAAMVHVHIRDDEHRPTLELSRLKDTVAALREGTGLVVQLSTGGSVHDPLEDRLRVLDAEPDSCSLTMGTTNFGNDVFLNPWPFVQELYQLSQERHVVPEFELFDHAEDPLNAHDVAAKHPDVVERLAKELDGWKRATLQGKLAPAGKGEELSSKEMERLRALGYL